MLCLQPDLSWDACSALSSDVRRFVASIDEFQAAFTQAHPSAENTRNRQNNGPSLRTILGEPLVRTVEGYIVTGRRDARVTLDGVYLDAKAVSIRQPARMTLKDHCAGYGDF